VIIQRQKYKNSKKPEDIFHKGVWKGKEYKNEKKDVIEMKG